MVYLSFKEGKTMLTIIYIFQLIIMSIICSILLGRGHYLGILKILTIFLSIIFFHGKYIVKFHKIKNIFFDDENYYINSEELSYTKSDLTKIKNNYLTASYIEFKDGKRFYFLRNPKLKFFDIID